MVVPSIVVALVRVAVEMIILIKVPLSVARLFLFVVEPNILCELSSYIFEMCVLCITFRFVTFVYVVVFLRAARAANLNLLFARTNRFNADLRLSLARNEQLLRFLHFDFFNFEKGVEVVLNRKREFNLV